ncbi:unnamed protein product [Rotaria sordida]|uniref:Uncharacterized protein n=2 Tax=Rotaria sordida TaxID=392033 RepID=A0A815T9C2_9BILA|nr:unnamed protein product [Rotaria sordida]CAF4071726.1 unnamed protein product [Rotaria sordida]
MATSISPIDDLQANANNLHLKIFSLIWLDADTTLERNRNAEQRLRAIINCLMKFQDVKKCQEYINKQSQKARLIMVVSGRLGQEIVPSIHNIRQVISIYVYCMDKNRHEQWARNFAKVKAIVVELDELILQIETDHRMQEIVEEPLSINIFTTSVNADTSAMGKSIMDVNEQLPPSDPLLYDLYQDLGKFASQVGNLDKSMEWRQKAIVLQQQNELAGKQSYE